MSVPWPPWWQRASVSSDRCAQFSGDLTHGQTRSGAGGRPHLIVEDCNCVHPQEYERRPEAFAALGTHPVAVHPADNPDGPQLTVRSNRRATSMP